MRQKDGDFDLLLCFAVEPIRFQLQRFREDRSFVRNLDPFFCLQYFCLTSFPEFERRDKTIKRRRCVTSSRWEFFTCGVTGGLRPFDQASGQAAPANFFQPSRLKLRGSKWPNYSLSLRDTPSAHFECQVRSFGSGPGPARQRTIEKWPNYSGTPGSRNPVKFKCPISPKAFPSRCPRHGFLTRF